MANKFDLKCYTTGPFEENVYLLTGESGKEAALFDPGFDSEFILDEIKKRGIKLIYVINTHCHVDHAARNAYFLKHTEAKLVVHPSEKGYLSSLKEQGYFFGVRAENSPAPDIELEESVPVLLDGIDLKAIHTPGHTPGGTCFYFEGVLISGDTLFAGSIGRTDLPGGSFEQLISSIKEKLFSLPDETVVYPGHGPPTTIGAEKRYNPFLSSEA